MKKIYKLMSILALAAITAACAEKLPEPENPTPDNPDQEQEEPTPEPVVGQITLSSAEAIVLSDEGASQEITFTATLEWTAESSDEFVTVEPESGEAGDAVVTVTVGANEDYDPRTATVTLTCGEDVKTINLTQKQKGALLLTESTFTVAAEGQVVTVLAKANSNVTYAIAEDAQSWITPSVAPNGLVDYSFNFEVAANESEQPRTGQIVFSNEAGNETVTIEQAGAEPKVTFHAISDAASLQEFATRVAAGETALEAQVTASFDASSLIWVPVENYTGFFDGNGQTITGLTQPLFGTLSGTVKNLTLESTINATAADDLNWGFFAKVVNAGTLEACTAKGSLTYTPSSALADICQIGGLVGNNFGGTITGCTNEATVTMGDSGETHASQVSVGGIVGRTQKNEVPEGSELQATQGNISNCTNNGTVICNAKLSENVYLGGVIGFQVEKAEAASGCVNNGLVKLGSTFATEKALHIGGVIGVGKGTIENCSNGANGVVTTEDGATAGTYICQGGVVGRLSSDAGEYSGLANAGKINAAAAGAGSGSYIGGTVGRCDEGSSISNCTNTGGKLEYTGVTSTCPVHIGGIVGQSKTGVSSCTNATEIVVGGEYTKNESGKYLSIGGIVGRQAADVELSNNTNTAAVTFSGYATGYTALGGIVGYCDGPISGGGNSGTISFTGYNNTNNIPIGGIVARTPGSKSGDRITGVTNSGTIVINSESQTKKEFYVGAVVGHSQSGNVSATNTGKVEVVKFKCTTLYIGGVAGYNLAGNLTATNSGSMQFAGLNCGSNLITGGVVGRGTGEINATNSGNIEVAEVTCNNLYAGGIAGKTESGSLTTGTNNGGLTISEACTVNSDLLAGGITGTAGGELKDCTNTGALSNACALPTSGKYLDLGGIVGYNNDSSPLTNCSNSGNVINTGNSAGYICVGGISGENDAAMTECHNTGNISNSGCTANDYPTCLGGVTGLTYSEDLTSCSSSVGEVLNTSACTTVRTGGVAGYINASEAVTFDKCINSSPVNVDNECESSIAEHIIAGGVVGRSIAPITFNECKNDGAVCVDLYGENNTGGVRAGGIFGDTGERKDPTKDENIKAYDTNCNKCVNNGDVEIFLNYSAASIKIQNYIAGGIGGRLDKSSESGQVGGVIKECSNTGYIHIQSNAGVVGGILGQMQDGEVLNCSNTGTIYYRYNKSTDHYACGGGIVANAWASARKIDGCTNSGEVQTRSLTNSSTLANYTGGILGWAEENIVVSNCENTGSVICSTCTDNKAGAAIAGGIIGYKESTGKDFNNTNKGNIRALAVTTRAAAAGGIVGAIHYGTVEACYNYGAIEAGEKASGSNYSDSNSTYSVGRAGSIAGFYHTSAQSPYKACEGTITKCYVGGTVQGKHTSGEVVTITAENFGGNIVGWGDDPTDCFFAENQQ